MTPRERWLATAWPFVREHLPARPARVVELGCGSLGGFVPRLRRAGYDAVGVDPEAPDAPGFLRAEFERAELPEPVQAVVASTSLHHVADPDRVIERIAAVLEPGAVVVVVEWDWGGFDRGTADWCFARLRPDGEETFLHRRRDEWLASGREWSEYLRGWARGHGLHEAGELVRLLDERFERRHLDRGPYFFAHLEGTEEADERAAIDAGAVRATRIDYVATAT